MEEFLWKDFCGRFFLGGFFWEDFSGRIFVEEFLWKVFYGRIFVEVLLILCFKKNCVYLVFCFGLAGADVADSVYEQCGSGGTRQCFGAPDDCIASKSCTSLLSYGAMVGDDPTTATVPVDLYGNPANKYSSAGWIGFGLSMSGAMVGAFFYFHFSLWQLGQKPMSSTHPYLPKANSFHRKSPPLSSALNTWMDLLMRLPLIILLETLPTTMCTNLFQMPMYETYYTVPSINRSINGRYASLSHAGLHCSYNQSINQWKICKFIARRIIPFLQSINQSMEDMQFYRTQDFIVPSINQSINQSITGRHASLSRVWFF